MASKCLASSAFILSLNLLFFSFVGSSHVPSRQAPCVPTTPKVPGHHSQPAVPACPRDALKFGVCANLLRDLVHLVMGTPPKTPCCSLLSGLADLEAAACLCTAIKANILGLNLNVPVSLSLLLHYCGMQVPYGFKCA
ncbi:14 kDa proline-rich protein DC2.15-like [Punica granatum]|uniref:Bifunctional inhibitor/plant lipid transfer protein/seed storage helical domain-containing protein n=2 Tax=Punica granatum TaxID=22663 RepID=A0A218XP58_PUNGR|nr:14 kDa proline-rich protein DC2.15-like [Punica granatum]OWM86449.1 hypothetical protein CDL15_Pgr021536 [Punica granatum]PKI39824.1 hypothetical protein CRG98_039869 [Punica granatum]